MHKDPPPGLFDARRPLAHVVTHGLIVGFVAACVAHFGWSLWRQNSGAVALPPAGGDALVSGINRPQSSPKSGP